MKFHQAEALILEVSDLQEADRIVVFLTREQGKRRGVARGAKRRFSRFAGELQPLAKARIGWFEKEGRDLVRIASVELVRAGEAPAARPRRDPPRRLRRRAGVALRPGGGAVRGDLPPARRDASRRSRRGATGTWWRATSRAGCCAWRESSRRRTTARSAARPLDGGAALLAERRGAFSAALRAERPRCRGGVARGGRVLAADRAREPRHAWPRDAAEAGGARRGRGGRPGGSGATSCSTSSQSYQVHGAHARRARQLAGAVRDPGTTEEERMKSFQELILALSDFWAGQGCVLQQPYDLEVGAGTMHPGHLPARARARAVARRLRPAVAPAGRRRATATTRSGSTSTTSSRSSSSRRRSTCRSSTSSSLEAMGIDLAVHDLRFEEDNWEAPTLGAWGVGWQVMLDGMEITQFTYFQQAGGIDLAPISCEITYGLERITMFLGLEKSIYDIDWVPGGVDLRPGAPAGRVRVLEVRLRDRRRRLPARASSTATSARRGAASRPGSCCRPTSARSSARTCSTCSTPAARSR